MYFNTAIFTQIYLKVPGGEVVAHLQDQVWQGSLQQGVAALARHHGRLNPSKEKIIDFLRDISRLNSKNMSN